MPSVVETTTSVETSLPPSEGTPMADSTILSANLQRAALSLLLDRGAISPQNPIAPSITFSIPNRCRLKFYTHDSDTRKPYMKTLSPRFQPPVNCSYHNVVPECMKEMICQEYSLFVGRRTHEGRQICSPHFPATNERGQALLISLTTSSHISR